MILSRKPQIWVRLTSWVRRHRTTCILVASALILVAAGCVVFIILSQNSKEPEASAKTVVNKPKPIKYYSPLTGVEVTDEAATKQAATAIMIENSPDARPQSGLKNSGVVFEAIAEGGITRFLVLYQQEKPSLIGPVRSLRIYYIDWLAPFDASVAHVGGSAAALNEIRNGSYRDIDQFFNAAYYWRATDRWAPHNVYTNFEKLDALSQAKGYTTSNVSSFSRKNSVGTKTPTATSIDVNISSYLYNSHYDYIAETNTYNRSQAGASHLDREDGQISPRVVIILKTAMAHVFEDGWREQYVTVGSGPAEIFQDGTVQEVTWHKNGRAEQITFTDAENKNVALSRGQTWITAIEDGIGGVTWQ
jgi:hypothetical protein